VCCSGMAYTGTCCSDSECSSPMVCTDHACSEPSQPEQRYPPWLGGYWNFDEGSGTIAHDLSGNGNTGTLNGTNWTTGNISGALQFDGVDDYVEVSNSPSIQFNGQAFSVSAWIKPAATTYASRNIAQKDNMNYGNQFPWQLYHYGTGIYFKVRDNSTTRQVVVSSGVGTSAYSHIAATFDPAGNMSLYINGQEKASLNISGFTFDNSSGTYPLRIGAMSYTSGFYFNGTIDEVMILNLTLSAEQVSYIYGYYAIGGGGYFGYASTLCHRPDLDCSGCVSDTELDAFIDRWKVDSSDVTLTDLMEAIGLWKKGGC